MAELELLLRRRMIEDHDGPEYVACDPAILHQRGFKVQPRFGKSPERA